MDNEVPLQGGWALPWRQGGKLRSCPVKSCWWRGTSPPCLHLYLCTSCRQRKVHDKEKVHIMKSFQHDNRNFTLCKTLPLPSLKNCRSFCLFHFVPWFYDNHLRCFWLFSISCWSPFMNFSSAPTIQEGDRMGLCSRQGGSGETSGFIFCERGQ